MNELTVKRSTMTNNWDLKLNHRKKKNGQKKKNPTLPRCLCMNTPVLQVYKPISQTIIKCQTQKSCRVPEADLFFAHLSKHIDFKVQGCSLRKYLPVLSLISLDVIHEKSDMTLFPKQASDKEGTNNFIQKVCFICPAVQMRAILCFYKWKLPDRHMTCLKRSMEHHIL